MKPSLSKEYIDIIHYLFIQIHIHMELDGKVHVLEAIDSFSWETDTFDIYPGDFVFELYPMNCCHQNHLVVKTTSDWWTIFGLLYEIT